MKEIEKAIKGEVLTKEEIVTLLSITDKNEMEELFAAARQVREKTFGKKIFMYGFVYFSTWCRNNCNFCYYRKSNNIERYRKDPKEVVELAVRLAESGVHLLDLTMGEDPIYHKENFASVLKIAEDIKKETGLPVMLSPGVISDELIDSFAELGVEWFALYQETHNREIFKNLRINQDYDERMHAKLYAKEKGILIEEGLLAGIGESYEDIAESILEMKKIGASQVRVMSFIPQKGSPMESVHTPGRELELKIIALLRLVHPKALIPASLDVDGIEGLQCRIDSGSNVVTSIIPPLTGLAGVAQNSMDVDEGGRTVQEVSAILREMGMEPATALDYRTYIDQLFAENGK